MARRHTSAWLLTHSLFFGLSAALVVRPPARPPFGDPLGLHSRPSVQPPAALPLLHGAAAALPLLGGAAAAKADLLSGLDPSLDPRTFQPVCPASDGFYRFGQTLVVGLVGQENVKEYAPLIAGGLLRVRLELCVVESFVYEAIIPFVKENGLSWVLPLHETVETFLAGVVFAVASNFILIGSTKIITVIFTYGDFFLGFPLRVVGKAGWRGLEERAKPPPAEPSEPPKEGVWAVLDWFQPKPKPNPPTLEQVVKANQKEPAQLAQLGLWGSFRAAGRLPGWHKEIGEPRGVGWGGRRRRREGLGKASRPSRADARAAALPPQAR